MKKINRLLLAAGIVGAAALGVIETVRAGGTNYITGSYNYQNGLDTDQRSISATILMNGTNRLSGAITVNPNTTTTYDLSSIGASGTVFIAEVTPTNVTGFVLIGDKNTNMWGIMRSGDPTIYRPVASMITFTNTGSSPHLLQPRCAPF